MEDPRDRFDFSIRSAAAALVDQRAALERGRREQDARHEALVGAEERLRVLVNEARRARWPRHLRPGEEAGPRRAPADGPASSVPVAVDDRTRFSLQLMGLARPEAPSPDLLARMSGRS